jgi:DNA-binding NarL/FixJ family response regulator
MRRKSKDDGDGRRQRVLLVDGHVLMRRVAAEWINRSAGLTVCGMAGGMAEALEAVNRLRPDIVVSEMLRPHDVGFIRELHRRHPRLPILLFTIQDQALYGKPAAEAGASGYLMKEAGGDKLVQSIRAVLRRRNTRRISRNPDQKARRLASAFCRGNSAKG